MTEINPPNCLFLLIAWIDYDGWYFCLLQDDTWLVLLKLNMVRSECPNV